MQADACHEELSKYDHKFPVAQWLEPLTGVLNVVGSIPIRDSDLFYSMITTC